MGWWVEQAWAAGPVVLISHVAWVIGSIVLHELAHGWAAIRSGDRTPIETGHMTWNPLVHMGGMSLVVFALVGIAWGLMPVNPSRFRRRYDDAFVAVAGPAMNLSLAIVSIIAAAAIVAYGNPQGSTPMSNLLIFFSIGGMLNLVLMFFNLIPVPPLDGARIVANFVPSYNNFMQTETGRLFALAGFMLLFFFAGRVLFTVAEDIQVRAVVGLAKALKP